MSEPEHAVETADAQTGAVTTPAPPITNSQQPMANSQQPTASSPPPTTDLSQVRELVLKAHPDVVPDLVRGGSVDELIASVEPARTAYQRIADQVRSVESGVGSRESGVQTADRASGNDPPPSPAATIPIVVQPPVVPAGGGTTVADPGDFAPTTKIAQALAARKARG
jgi:hypothetical protein